MDILRSRISVRKNNHLPANPTQLAIESVIEVLLNEGVVSWMVMAEQANSGV